MKKKLFSVLAALMIAALQFSYAQNATKETQPPTNVKLTPVKTTVKPVSAEAKQERSTQATKNPASKTEVNQKANGISTTTESKPILKKDGTPDKRYKSNKTLKMDGTPDKRFKENKTNNKSTK